MASAYRIDIDRLGYYQGEKVPAGTTVFADCAIAASSARVLDEHRNRGIADCGNGPYRPPGAVAQ